MKSKVQGCQTMFDGSIQKWTARLSIPPQWLCRGKTPSSAVHSRPQDPRLSCASPGIKYIIRHFMPSKNLSDKDTTWAIQCWYSWGGVKVTYTLEKHFPKLIDLIILVLSTFGGNMWKPCGSSSLPHQFASPLCIFHLTPWLGQDNWRWEWWTSKRLAGPVKTVG